MKLRIEKTPESKPCLKLTYDTAKKAIVVDDEQLLLVLSRAVSRGRAVGNCQCLTTTTA